MTAGNGTTGLGRPLAFGHIALTVPDVDAAIEWYSDLFGFQKIAGPDIVEKGPGQFWDVVEDVFGPRLEKFRLAHLRSANGVALELFEFIAPAYEPPEENFAYWRGGFNHVCVVDPDIEGLVERIQDRGGRLRTSRIWPLFEGEPFLIAYCEDPWGSVIEIYSHSHEQTFANRGEDATK
jgi:catechol 2,3-dioxygenase-like lactoylglutathione lyase family enzyme